MHIELATQPLSVIRVLRRQVDIDGSVRERMKMCFVNVDQQHLLSFSAATPSPGRDTGQGQSQRLQRGSCGEQAGVQERFDLLKKNRPGPS